MAYRQNSVGASAVAALLGSIAVAVDGAINDRIDDAYRAKYRSSQYLAPMISDRSRAATVKIVPSSR